MNNITGFLRPQDYGHSTGAIATAHPVQTTPEMLNERLLPGVRPASLQKGHPLGVALESR